MFDWFDDDEVLMDPPPSTKEPPCSTPTGNQSRGGEEVPKSHMREVPEQHTREVPAHQTMGVPTGQAMGVPEQQAEANPEQQVERAPEQQAEQRSIVEEPRPPPQSTGVDSMVVPRGSGRHRRFKKLNRQTKP